VGAIQLVNIGPNFVERYAAGLAGAIGENYDVFDMLDCPFGK
jgi:hypothetical protein